MLCDQTPTDERGGELRAGRGETEVGHECRTEPDPGTRAVDRRDDRLADRRRVPDQALLVGCDGVRVGVIALEAVHVRAGAEALAGARDDDHADVVVVLGLVQQLVVTPRERRRSKRSSGRAGSE